MKQLELSQNKVALVDDEDFEWLDQWKWHAMKSRCDLFYAVRSERVGDRQRRVWLHRLILGLQPGEQCDHRNGNGLDNRRSNIRKATQKENNLNRRKFKTNKSGVTGVSWNWKHRRWQANAFISKDDAIAARRKAEARHYAGFVRSEGEPEAASR